VAIAWEASYGAAVTKAKQRSCLLMVEFFSPH